MDFFYNTAAGRVLLKILLHTRALKLIAAWLNSPSSKILINSYIRNNKIDMRPFRGQKYSSFAGFFSRKKETGSVPQEPDILISPCDGMLSAVPIRDNSKFCVKNSLYTIYDLIPDKDEASYFKDGLCLIFRLRASDYHHFCYMDDCYHEKSHFIEGMLHSVQPSALEKEPVFRLNRRRWSIMRTKNFGKVAQIEVGAVFVGGMVHESEESNVSRGDDMGYFTLCGSTIILMFNKDVRKNLKLKGRIAAALKNGGEYPVKIGHIIGKTGGE